MDIPVDFSDIKKKDFHKFLCFFTDATDFEVMEIIPKLPVNDIEAMDPKFINGKLFVDFIEVMKITLSYEILIQKCYANIITLIDSEWQAHNTRLNRDVRKEINRNLAYATRYKQLVKQDRARLKEGKKPKAIVLKLSYNELFNLMPTAADDMPFLQEIYFNDLTEENIQIAIAEIEKEIKNSKNRVSTIRRREFRKSLIRNYDWVYDQFLPNLRKNFQLHETKIDRIVIDVYDEQLFTYISSVFDSIENNELKIKKNFGRGRVITEALIETIKELHGGKDGIDGIVARFESQRASQLQAGINYRGTITFVDEETGIKGIFTWNPKKKGAPIRLRIIANIQTIVQRELFELFPDKKELYRNHTWLRDSEINFIMPEDYEFYKEREQAVCQWLEDYARDEYIDRILDHLGTENIGRHNLVVNVAQVEVCYESPFFEGPVINPTIKQHFKSPSLIDYFVKQWAKFHKFADEYCMAKYDIKTERPVLNFKLPSLVPGLSLMQVKQYPKFYNLKGKKMIRTEFIPTRYMKYSYADADDLPLSQKVLSNPEWFRETIEYLFCFELQHNGINGQGYNRRFKEWKNPNLDETFITMVKTSIFGSLEKAAKYHIQFQSFLDTGKLPKTLPAHYKKKMEAFGYVTKKKRGEYLVTESFSRLMTQHTGASQ